MNPGGVILSPAYNFNWIAAHDQEKKLEGHVATRSFNSITFNPSTRYVFSLGIGMALHRKSS
jgi:hypothetical protein